MNIRQNLAIAAFAAGIGGLIAPPMPFHSLARAEPWAPPPALAQTQDGAGGARDHGIGRTEDGGHTGHGMMSRGGMSARMMGSGCAGMMQSMNDGDGRPNSPWRTHPPAGKSMPN
jgi:hypothetical protein